MNWAQLLGLLGAGAASGVAALRLWLAHRRFVLKHRVLKAVIERQGSTPEQWRDAAESLAIIDVPFVLHQLLPRREPAEHRDQRSIPNQRTR